MKVKVIYEETYKRNDLWVKSHLLPTLPHVPAPFVVDRCTILKAGRAEVDGVTMEYQELRVYFKEQP
jgi:hypothetical protein